MNETWTKPYYGIQHLGEFSIRNYWVTVCDYGSFTELTKHFPGCGFSPIQETFKTVELARAEGEKYYNAHKRSNSK